MKRTPLYEKHQALGAKIVPFAGYEMPVSYTGINAEHQAVREAVGMFDVSHMGEFIVEGPGALDLLQYVTSNDVSALFPGRVQYSCLPNEEGGIVDDLLVYMLAENRYMLVVNASNREKDLSWIKSNNQWDCTVEDVSDDYALLAVQGPKATDTLQKLTEENLREVEYYHFRTGTFAGVSDVIISATGYTGSGGFELYIPAADAPKVWDAVMEAGKEFGIQPAGLGARDTLRLEMGFCLYGNDIDDQTSPLQAGLGWITKFGKEFIAKDKLQSEKAGGPAKKLVGLRLEDRVIPRQHFEILDAEGQQTVGEVTSGTMAPSLGQPVAMGYVPKELSKEGTKLKVRIRNKLADAEVVRLPFYKR